MICIGKQKTNTKLAGIKRGEQGRTKLTCVLIAAAEFG